MLQNRAHGLKRELRTLKEGDGEGGGEGVAGAIGGFPLILILLSRAAVRLK